MMVLSFPSVRECLTAGVVLLMLAWTHPWLEYPPSAALPAHQPGINPELSTGDLQFYEVPDPAELTDNELLMICGTATWPDGRPMRSWSDHVFAYVNLAYKRLGYVPACLDPDVLEKVYGAPITPEDREFLATLKSPITGDYPRLREEERSPGNLYVRVLTQEEKEYTAANIESFRRVWLIGSVRDEHLAATVHVEVGPVFYWVVYGYDSVILSTVKYETRVKEIDYDEENPDA